MQAFHQLSLTVIAGVFMFLPISVFADNNSSKENMNYKKPGAVIDTIADTVIANPQLKPLTRKALKPTDTKFPLYFYGQKKLTKAILESYLDRAIVHMAGSPSDEAVYSERSRQFLKDTGTNSSIGRISDG